MRELKNNKNGIRMIRNSIYFLTLLLTTAIFFGCATQWEEAYRQEGYKYHEISFNLYPETPDFYKEVKIGDTIIHFSGSKKYFIKKYQDPKLGVVGYATCKGYTDSKGQNHYTYHVYILAKKYKNQIIYNHAVLGHELGHILNFKDSSFANPDKLKELDELVWVSEKSDS
jgi:hypothetical protein